MPTTPELVFFAIMMILMIAFFTYVVLTDKGGN